MSDNRTKRTKKTYMEIGEYIVVIENDAGTVQAEVSRATRTGRPMRGETVIVGEERYRVDRVVHEEVQGATIARYTVPRLFVRPVTADRGDRGPGKRPTPSDLPASKGKLLPFTAVEQHPPGGLPLALARLIAIVVACGYYERACSLRAIRRTVVPGRVRGEHRVILVGVAEDLDRLLHRAEAHYTAACRRIEELSDLMERAS